MVKFGITSAPKLLATVNIYSVEDLVSDLTRSESGSRFCNFYESINKLIEDFCGMRLKFGYSRLLVCGILG